MNDLFAIADALHTSPDYLIRGQHGVVQFTDADGNARMMIDFGDEVDTAMRFFPRDDGA